MQNGQALEASLGYYIFPLLAVALGFVVLGERFSLPQALAIAMAAAGGGGVDRRSRRGALDWRCCSPSTFAAYGLVKNRVALGPMMSVFVETLILAPLALVWLWGLHAGPGPTSAGGRAASSAGASGPARCWPSPGPMTGGPLVLFSYAARRIPYATLGLVQYLNPTLQFLVGGARASASPSPVWHALAFPLIWGGLALYSWASWRQASARSRSRSAGTLS